MSEPVALDDIKVHLGLDPSATADDAYLQSLITAARRMVEQDTGRTIVADEPTLADEDFELAMQAIRLIVGGWYANREAVTASDSRTAPAAVPMAAMWILSSLRVWDDGSD